MRKKYIQDAFGQENKKKLGCDKTIFERRKCLKQCKVICCPDHQHLKSIYTLNECREQLADTFTMDNLLDKDMQSVGTGNAMVIFLKENGIHLDISHEKKGLISFHVLYSMPTPFPQQLEKKTWRPRETEKYNNQ